MTVYENKIDIKHITTGFMLVFLAACAGTNGVSSRTAEPSEAAKNAPEVLEMRFEKGQLLSLISLAPKPGTAAASVRKTYTGKAFGLAGKFGLKPAGSLPVAAVGVGTFSPSAISFFSWPDTSAEERFQTQQEWPAIKATRPEGWDELRIHDVVLERDLTLRFASGKTYTMATAWINPDHPNDYDHYLTNIEKAVTASGGRYFYQMHEPRFESLATTRGAPGRITFVEWDSPQGLARFQKTAGFKSNVRYLQSGTIGFELLVLGAPAG